MKTFRILNVFLAACVCTVAFGAGRQLPDTAKIMPPETMALLNIQDFDSLQKQFQNTNLYKFYKDPAMAAFVSAFQTKWQKNLRESSDEMVKIITDINALPSGRLAAALILNEKTKKTGEPVFLVISQWGKNSASIKTVVEKTVKKAIDKGARQEKESVRGYQIITITQKEAAPKKEDKFEMNSDDSSSDKPSPDRFVGISAQENNAGGKSTKDSEDEEEPSKTVSMDTSNVISYCFVDDVLIIAEDKEILKFVISRLEGGSGQSLADNTNYQAVMAAVGPVHDIDLYVNAEQIVKSIAAQDNEGQMRAQIGNFGLDNVACLGAAVSVGRGSGTQAAVKGLLKINGNKKGIMKIVEPQSMPLQVPRFVDASSVSLSIFNISLRNAYNELSKIMSGISPGFAAALNAPIVPGDENGQGKVELKKDILDYISPQIIVANSIKKPFTAGSDPARTITAIAITDKTAIEKSLATLHGFLTGGKAEFKRELGGYTIYLMDLGTFPFMPGMRGAMGDEEQKNQPRAPKMAFIITDTHIVLGSEENVTQAIRMLNSKDTDSLMTAAWFARAKSAIPGSVGIAGLSDSRAYGEYLWWNLKEKGKAKSDSNAFDPTQMALSGLSKYFDFDLLPEFDTVKKYFGVSAQYMVSRPDGFYFEAKQLDLKPE